MELETLLARSESLPPRPDVVPFALELTDRSGHAATLARDFIAASLGDNGQKGGYYLLMAAGGDGTSLELVAALMELEPEKRSRFLVLRLPFGTGNDGSDGRDLVESLGRLLGVCASEARPAIRCRAAASSGRGTFWAFNIASFGLDAYVAHMTNRLKSLFPGDSYKLWVDLSTVLYDRIFRVVPMGIRAWRDAGEPVRDLRRACLLLAIGASGNRQYGSNKRILPDEDNVCAISQTGLFTKLAAKGRIERGLHRGLPIVDLFSAYRIEVEYGERVLFQADGEVVDLKPSDFPFTLDIEPNSYNVLRSEGE
jgi:diacylglycerol kinase family enzyme